MNEISSRIVREGDRQVVELPKELGIADSEVTIAVRGDVITITPKRTRMSLQEALSKMQPLTEEEWPNITDDDLLPLRDIKL